MEKIQPHYNALLFVLRLTLRGTVKIAKEQKNLVLVPFFTVNEFWNKPPIMMLFKDL